MRINAYYQGHNVGLVFVNVAFRKNYSDKDAIAVRKVSPVLESNKLRYIRRDDKGFDCYV